MHKTDFSLYTTKGQRKYLNGDERHRFFEATQNIKSDKKLFCQILYFTGARISEVYNLMPLSIDHSNKTIVFETLKKRRKGIYREIPVPDSLLDGLSIFIKNGEKTEENRLWDFSLRTASRHVKKTMAKANIVGQQASAKGLRHGFAVHAVSKVPITLVKKWLGHAKLETTEIYLSVIGLEEREMAKRMWDVTI